MDVMNMKKVWWLTHQGSTLMASPDITHLFRVIARRLGKRMYEVTVKEAMESGYSIVRA
jgi:hypothetical protein